MTVPSILKYKRAMRAAAITLKLPVPAGFRITPVWGRYAIELCMEFQAAKALKHQNGQLTPETVAALGPWLPYVPQEALDASHVLSLVEVKRARAAGVESFGRYDAALGNPGKQLTHDEVLRIHQQGGKVFVTGESTDHWMETGGYAAGRAAALAYRNQWGKRFLYLADDKDSSEAAILGPVAQCCDGAASILGRRNVGIYGGGRACELLLRRTLRYPFGRVRLGWMAAASSWAHGFHPRVAILQGIGNFLGIGDPDTQLMRDAGQW